MHIRNELSFVKKTPTKQTKQQTTKHHTVPREVSALDSSESSLELFPAPQERGTSGAWSRRAPPGRPREAAGASPRSVGAPTTPRKGGC